MAIKLDDYANKLPALFAIALAYLQSHMSDVKG